MKKIEIIFGTSLTKNKSHIWENILDAALLKLDVLAMALFGGYTSYRATGGWVDDKGKKFHEDSINITIFQGDMLNLEDEDALDAKITQIVDLIKTELQQASVAVVTTEANIRYK